MTQISQEELKKLFSYDPITDKFTRLSEPNAFNIGSIDSYGYLQICILGTKYLAHRLAFLYMEGYWPEHEIDHKNKIKIDNRWCNLREVSRSCNRRNCDVYKSNKSGVSGIIYHISSQKYMAYITVNKKKIYLGVFINKDDAVKTRWNAEKEYNFPDCQTTSSAYLYIKRRNLCS